MLTTGSETITGTDKNDLITGVVSSLSSEKTLDAADVIDGAAGTDTMNVDLKGSFAGLGTDGSIKNVENINLTNNTTIDRTFNAKNIEGVEKYTLTSEKAISLSNLVEAGIEVNAKGLQNNYSVAFNSDLDLTGTSDAMTLSFDGVGAAAVKNSSGTVTTAQKNVAVTMANIEDLTLKTSGTESFVSLANVDATSYTISGDANLTVSAVKDGLTSIDASELTGNFKIDATGVTTANSITSITSGSGDDEITIDTADLTANASINGGTGTDTLVVKDSSGNTVQYAMSNVETVEFENANATIFSATNVSDLDTVQINALAAGAAVDVVNLGSRDITVQTEGVITAGQDVSVDNSGTATVNFNAKDADAAKKLKGIALANSEAAAGDVTLKNAAAAVINVNDYVNFTAALNATKATDVTLNIASAKNSATTPTEQTGFTGDLIVAKATSLTIDANGTLTTAAATDIKAVESLTLDTEAHANLSNGNLESAATIILSGSNKNSQVSLATIGTDGTTAVDYDLSIEATGLKAGFTQTGDLASQQNITVDTSAVTGNVSLAVGKGIVGQNVTLNNISAAGAYTATTIDATSAGKGIATLNLSDAAKAVTVGNIGGTTDFDTVSIDVSGALDDVTLGTITANKVTVNAENALKNVFVAASADQTTADITVKDSLTFTAGLNAADDAAAGSNGVTIATTTTATDTTITLNGNIGDDYFTILGGDAAADAKITVKGDLDIGANTLTVNTSAITGAFKSTIDLSGLSAATGSIITIIGSDNADTITGTGIADIIQIGDAQFAATESIDGGAGTDVLQVIAQTTKAIDFSTGTLKNIETIAMAAADHAVTLSQGTGVTSISGYADGTSGSVVLKGATTAFGAAAQATKADVDVAGEWFFAAETATTHSYLTYYDETASEVVTITLVGTMAATANDSAASAAGDITITIA